ncbi:hypothetical protein FIU89_05025 [Roseovarius sp. THAF27]|uniref:DUF6166 domain-containing protein n=1 Tax=Roseovarius sp. THAF27 TaxID=2587850 RepID=UPI0012A97F3B|nr:hypothetical protein FIU89_05025 [Roseovarius sp. THAF27]
MAFALIYDVTGDAGLARRLAEPFMREVTVNFGNDWEMTEADIRAAIIQVQPEQRERLRKYEPGTCRSCPAAVTAFAAGGVPRGAVACRRCAQALRHGAKRLRFSHGDKRPYDRPRWSRPKTGRI